MNYVAPGWLPGGNLQTIWPALYSRRVYGAHPQYQRQRWTAPDADFVDVDWLVTEMPTSEQTPLLVLFHGLEGSSRSHYAEAFADFASEKEMAFAVPHFRGCSGEINLAPRAYHSGDYAEIDWILQRMSAEHTGPIYAVGVSLGGNALLRWAEERGNSAAEFVQAVAAVSSPIDLAASGWAIGRGFNRLVYTRMFLQTMKPRALLKLEQYPGLFDREALLGSRDLYEFDNVFTAPLHGFQSTEDYWARASAKTRLPDIRIPALVVNARNDPFVPFWSLPSQSEVGPCVTLWHPAHGGHVGFPSGRVPGHVRSMPDAVGSWLLNADHGVRPQWTT
jgi:predicted alpha/beta-fold hydrolase